MCQRIRLLTNGTAIQNRSCSPPNHNYILLPTPFSSGCCHFPSWPVEPPVSLPQTRGGGGRICYAEAGFCKACLGSPTCLGCIGQKVSYLRPLHLQLDVFPLTYGLFWALTASLLCFPHCLGASWGPHTLCVLWFPWKTLPCCLSVRCWGVMGYNQHLIVCEDLLFFWYKGVYIFYVLC